MGQVVLEESQVGGGNGGAQRLTKRLSRTDEMGRTFPIALLCGGCGTDLQGKCQAALVPRFVKPAQTLQGLFRGLRRILVPHCVSLHVFCFTCAMVYLCPLKST